MMAKAHCQDTPLNRKDFRQGDNTVSEVDLVVDNLKQYVNDAAEERPSTADPEPL